MHRTWKNALRHDWIPERVAKSLPVLEFYTGLRWTETRKALENYKKQMTSIYDIFNVIDLDKEPGPKNIFIEGKWDTGIKLLSTLCFNTVYETHSMRFLMCTY